MKATFDGVAYTGSLIRYGNPLHMLPLPKAIRSQIGKEPGDTVTIDVCKDDELRTLEVPVPFEEAMKKEGVISFFEHLSYTHRSEYCRWISGAKKEETRAKRLRKAIEMLRSGVKTPDEAK